MASILTVQALFFADGGLLALGCNIFNLGLVPCFVAYPLVYKSLAGDRPSRGRVMAASMASAIVGLQLGALGVVMETWLSGVSELPLSTFALLMQPIHLAIGIVEGFVTAAVVTFIWTTRPEVLQSAADPGAAKGLSMRGPVIGLLAVAVITGGVLSWFASTHPDGLEWAMLHTSGKEELQAPGDGLHEALGRLQERVAVLPDYGFKNPRAEEGPNAEGDDWPAVKTGTTVSGLVGGAVTMGLALLIGLALRKRGRASS
jgi:cobalt/nickel transport system permease protein